MKRLQYMREVCTIVALAGALAAFAGFAPGCQVKSAPASAGTITADPGAFVIHDMNRYADNQAQAIMQNIIVISVTFTNTDHLPQLVAPSKFVLLDQNTQATFYALSGGDIRIPNSVTTNLDPGKSIDVTLGFRVPATLTSALLMFRP